MSKLEKEFQEDYKNRIKNLENELEEFRNGVREENLRLRIPYVTDNRGDGLGLSLAEDDDGKLCVYLKGEIAGYLKLE